MNLLQVLSYIRQQQEFKQEIKGYVSNEELYLQLVVVLIKKFSKCLKKTHGFGNWFFAVAKPRNEIH